MATQSEQPEVASPASVSLLWSLRAPQASDRVREAESTCGKALTQLFMFVNVSFIPAHCVYYSCSMYCKHNMYFFLTGSN